MALVIVVLSLGLGVLVLIGLLAVAKELFGESCIDIHCTDAEGAMDRSDLGRDAGQHRVMTP